MDIITGGSPCQDLSVAGRREGLAGERSGLFMEQIRIVKEMRNESIRQLRMRGADVDLRRVQPRYMVWENVVGALSSGNPKGGDFRCVLEEICRVADQAATVPMPEKGKWSNSGAIVGDGWSVAWRVHDAQFWGKTIRDSDTGDVLALGTPQRRRRISLVADFGSESAPEILFECESLSGNTDESGEKGQGTPDATESSSDPTITFQERAGKPGGVKESSSNTNEPALCQHSQTNSYVQEIAGTLDASYYKGCGERAGVEREVVCIEGNGSRESHKGDGYKESETMYTLNTVEQHAVCVGNGQLAQAKLSEKVGTLNCMHDQQAVMTYTTQACGDRDNPSQSFLEEKAYTIPSNPMSDRGQAVLAIDRASFNQGKNAQYDISVQEEIAQPIVARGPGGVMTQSGPYVQGTTKE